MTDILLLCAVLAILGGAGWYVYRGKKRGKRCVGCPYAGGCGGSGCSRSGCAR